MARTPAQRAPDAKRPGRPSKYRPEFAEQARKLGMLGLTDKELAVFFEVSESTIYVWKNDYPEFSEALKDSKALADAEVAAKLFRRATGYEHPEDDIRTVTLPGPHAGSEVVITPTIKHYPPDTTAAIFWLKNRQPALWRARVENESGGDDIAKTLTALINKLPG